jgi:hypothetical protein
MDGQCPIQWFVWMEKNWFKIQKFMEIIWSHESKFPGNKFTEKISEQFQSRHWTETQNLPHTSNLFIYNCTVHWIRVQIWGTHTFFTCVIPCILGYICYKSSNICTILSPLYYLFTFAYMFRPFMDHHQGVIRYQVYRLKCASIYNTRV